MNWKLIFLLSLFGLAMGIATVFILPSNIEPWVWLGVFVVCAVIIARAAPGRFFLHGLCVSLVNAVWITGSHVALYDTYITTHAQEVEAMKAMPISGRAAMLVVGPIVGLLSGLILGLFAFVASKIIKKPAPVATPSV
jgi:hypothetical protein